MAVVGGFALAAPSPSQRASATGGGTAGTLRLHQATSLQLAVSPDRRTIAVSMLNTLYTLPMAGGKAARRSTTTLGPEYPTWSPDGKTIAFQSYKTGTYHIWAMSPDGSDVRELTSGFYDDREPQFSPDGTQIAFSSDRPPAGSAKGAVNCCYNVWVLTLATGDLTQVTHASGSASDYYPTWSPDGKSLTYVNTSHEIDSVAADGSGPVTVLYKDPTATFYSPEWSPDGKSLAYVESVPGPATRLMVNGQAASGSEDVFTFPARWLSDDTVLYGGDGHILQRDLTTGAVATIRFTASVHFKRPAYTMKPYNFESTAAQRARGIVAPALSPNGQQVAFVALNQLWLMTIRQAPQQLTNDPYYKSDPTWSPDGRYLAYSSDKAGPEAIYIRTMATGATRKLTAPFVGSENEIAWSPDGKEIAFQTDLDTETDVNTYVADVASGRFRQVGPTLFEPGRPSWGPDSNILALSNYRPYSNRGGGLYGAGANEIYTINVNTGQTHWYDPYPYDSQSIRVLDDGPVWSPNGKYMAYILDDVLYVVPVTPDGAPAGPQRQVTYENADEISWSGDSEHLLYNSNGTLRMVSVNGGRPRTVPVRLTWHPALPTTTKVIHAGLLWAGTSGALQHNVDVVVRGNRIARVGPAQPRASYGSGVRYVDASKLTVIPGMWDAHVHEQLDQPYAGGRRDRIELAMGITSVMSMGDPAYSALEQSESQQSGARLGPRYFWAAEPVDGRRVYWNWMRATPNMTALSRELQRIVALDPDILKTYVRLPLNMQAKAIAVGHQLGIPSFSHFFWPALALGQDGTSHWVPERRGYKLSEDANSISYNDVVQLYARSGMSDTDNPYGLGAADYYPNLPNDPRMKQLLAPWQYSDAIQLYAGGPMTPAQKQAQENNQRAFSRIIAQGGTILAGTDASLGVGDFGAVVGMSTMARTGMSNYNTLRAATVEPAKIMGVSDQLGAIQPGMLADMDIIQGNPLQDINALANEVYVMQNGNLYTESDLIGPYADVNLNPSQSVSMTSVLTGANEVSPGNPIAMGYAVIKVNRVTGQVCTTITSDITDATAVMIHQGTAGVEGPVVIDIDPASINRGQSCQTVSVTLANQLIGQSIFAPPPPFYVNIHTPAYPNGAIRGQLTNSPPIPGMSIPTAASGMPSQLPGDPHGM